MIGNDIVDLQAAAMESNWQRAGYLHKIFTLQEQEWIYHAAEPDVMVWWLWSAKEAVYKIVNRATLQRRYAPLTFQCKTDGIMLHDGTEYYFRSEFTPDYIHTIAVMDVALMLQLEICTDRNIAYEKDINGLPMMDNRPVSVSHHGRYYAMVKEKVIT